ncbi:MAG: glutaredoxin domain-containing protein [Alcaligenaceae bacterium]|nr:glutaredoxin domain-containing protein [Alcaligenaceae bacterium]
MKLFISELCPDCPPIMKFLEAKNISVEVINITDSIPHLKEFLKLRDSRPEFEFIIQAGWVGIPCLLTDTSEILFEEEMRFRF